LCESFNNTFLQLLYLSLFFIVTLLQLVALEKIFIFLYVRFMIYAKFHYAVEDYLSYK